MRRRGFITGGAALTTALIAGCTGSPETEGNDDEPIEESPENLLLSIDDFDEAGWESWI